MEQGWGGNGGSLTSVLKKFSSHSSFRPHFLRTCFSSSSCLQSQRISVVLCGSDWLFGFLCQQTLITAFSSLRQLLAVKLFFPRFQNVAFLVRCLLFALVRFFSLIRLLSLLCEASGGSTDRYSHSIYAV